MVENNAQPTYRRQRFLLSFICQLKDSVTLTSLQKLVFLYTMKEHSEFYEFVPYKYGAYSFQLAEDVGILRKNGFLSNDAPSIRANGNYDGETTFHIASERGRNLLRKAYREYPYYTINSEVLEQLFHRNKNVLERLKNERHRYTQMEQVLFTIGYEGKSLEAFMNILIQNDVRLLCDVRRNSLSRKFGFSKKMLARVTNVMKIKYIHIPDLGIASSKRKSLDTAEDYRCLFQAYEKNLPSLKPQLESLYSLLCSENRVALMCFEKEPEMCHRHIIRDYLCNIYPIRSADL